MRHILVGSAVALSLALGACASKPKTAPATASSGPVGDEQSGSVGVAGGSVGAEMVPGSQADLLAKVGTDRVLFEYDSYALSNEAKAVLQRQAQWLSDNPTVSLTVEGHCDERGTREYNLALGDRRATAVTNYLGALGVSASRLRTISYGKERPEVTGSDDESYAQNRRAVSVVVGAMS